MARPNDREELDRSEWHDALDLVDGEGVQTVVTLYPKAG
jgi:hypothetical protein